MKYAYNYFLILFALLLFGNGFAYDKTGHRIIAQIANEHLSPKAKTKIESLLGKNGLVYYSTWADEMRSNSKFDYAVKWHYCNVDGDFTSKQLDSLFYKFSKSPENLMFAIDSLTAALKKNKDDTVALRFLIHFIGDLHQPLHLGRLADRGGNSIKIKWFDDATNIHSLWDSYLINMEQYSYTEYATYLTNRDKLYSKKLMAPDLLYSFKESYIISKKIYNIDYTQKLEPYKYSYTFSEDLKNMLFLGGYQLSALLNNIYV